MKRRQFVQWGIAVGATASKTMTTLFAQAPAVRSGAVKPVVVASANGNVYKNGGPQTGVESAFNLMTSGNADVLDALIAGVNICRARSRRRQRRLRRPAERRRRRAARLVLHARSDGSAPAAWRRSKACARRRWWRKSVMDTTDHHLLVGKGAQDFARNMGFKIEDDLNTEKSRKLWLEWKRRVDPQHYLDPKKRARGVATTPASRWCAKA